MGIFSMSGGPDDDGSLFRTRANTQFNSFNNPMPTLHMQGPGWGIDPSYLTPSYAAPYRPGYQEGAISSPRPGFFSSANQLTNPFATPDRGKYSDPYYSRNQYFSGVTGRPGDAFASGLQIAGAAGAWYYGQRAVQALNYGSVSKAAASSFWEGRAARAGGSLFQGFARGAMGGFASSQTGGLIAGGARLAGLAAGGVAAGFLAPALAAYGGIEAMNGAVFNPYINQRQMSRDFRENFSGVTFGSGQFGNVSTGRGLSASMSADISSQVAKSGYRNFSLSNKEISGISDLASRAGLLDNINPEQFAKQITSITKQVAMIAAVANDPDFRNSIEIMAKMKDAGLDVNKAGSFMTKLGGYSSIAGVSTKRMMEMGQQAQFLFGANNITPYLGQQQHAQTFASFASAKRNGLISTELLARLGGESGATQLSLTGQLSSTQTIYNQMLNTMKYAGGQNASGSIADNLSRFGSQFANNPLQTLGGMGLHQGRMASEQFKTTGGGKLATYKQVMDLARVTPGALKNGQIDDATMYALLTQNGIMGEQEARAYVAEMSAMNSPGGLDNMMSGLRSAQTTQIATMMEATGADGLLPVAWTKARAKEFGAGVQELTHAATSGFSKFISASSDFLEEGLNKANFGDIKGISDMGEIKLGGGARFYTNEERAEQAYDKGEYGKWLGLKAKGLDYTLGLDKEKTVDDYVSEYANSITKEFMDPIEGLRSGQFNKALSDLMAGNRSKEADLLEESMGTRDLKAFKPGIEKLQKEINEKYGGDWNKYLKATGQTPDQALISSMDGQNVNLSQLIGNERLNSVGNMDSIRQYKEIQRQYQEEAKGLVNLYQQGKMNTSEFTTMLNKTAAETNFSAAELQYKAAVLNAKAAGIDVPESATTSGGRPITYMPSSERAVGGA